MAWQIDINSDDTAVSLNLKKLISEDDLNYDDVVSALKDKNIPINADLEKRIHEVVEQIHSPGQHDPMPVLVQAQPAVNGEDGRFEWNEKYDPEKCGADQPDADRSSYYGRSSLILVGENDTIAILHPPTEGQPGTNVFGKTIACKPGNELKIEPGENVKLLPDGKTFVAQCDGQPKLKGTNLSIDQTIGIKTDVDFSVGNIDYPGNVNISGDIKDLFEVKTGGNLNVGGTIEAAKVECSGNLTVKRGISGKERGVVRVEKNINSKYLSNVAVWCHGDVDIQSEIVNVNLNCTGKLVLQRGAIHGGQVTAAGNIETPVLGSSAGTRTVVRAAIDPFLEQQIKELDLAKKQHSEKINFLMPKAQMLLQLCRGRPNDDLKKMAEEIKQAKQEVEQIDRKRAELNKEATENCNGIIIIHKLIYPGVVLYVGDVMKFIEHEIIGPLEVVRTRIEGKPETLALRTPAQTAAE